MVILDETTVSLDDFFLESKFEPSCAAPNKLKTSCCTPPPPTSLILWDFMPPKKKSLVDTPSNHQVLQEDRQDLYHAHPGTTICHPSDLIVFIVSRFNCKRQALPFKCLSFNITKNRWIIKPSIIVLAPFEGVMFSKKLWRQSQNQAEPMICH